MEPPEKKQCRRQVVLDETYLLDGSPYPTLQLALARHLVDDIIALVIGYYGITGQIERIWRDGESKWALSHLAVVDNQLMGIISSSSTQPDAPAFVAFDLDSGDVAPVAIDGHLGEQAPYHISAAASFGGYLYILHRGWFFYTFSSEGKYLGTSGGLNYERDAECVMTVDDTELFLYASPLRTIDVYDAKLLTFRNSLPLDASALMPEHEAPSALCIAEHRLWCCIGHTTVCALSRNSGVVLQSWTLVPGVSPSLQSDWFKSVDVPLWHQLRGIVVLGDRVYVMDSYQIYVNTIHGDPLYHLEVPTDQVDNMLVALALDEEEGQLCVCNSKKEVWVLS